MAGKKEYGLGIIIRAAMDPSFRKTIQNTENSLESLESIGTTALAGIATAATATVAAIGTITGASIKVGAAYEEQMSTVKAISGLSSAAMQELQEKAVDISATSAFTAKQVGEGYEYMAMAGWDASQQLASIESVMNLAAASGEELALVSDIVTDDITALGLKAEDAAHFTDVLAATTSASNTNISMMGETMKYVGSIAGSLNYDLEDVALSVGLLANSGIKSTQAGTNLRKIMTELSKDVELTGKAFAKAGEETGTYSIKTVESDGSMKDWVDTLIELRKGFSQLSDAEKTANATDLVGKNAMTGLLTLVNASESDFIKLSNAIENCDGKTKEMANTRLDNLNGDVTLLQSQMEALGIGVYEKIRQPLRDTVQNFTSYLGEGGTEFLNSGTIEKWLENLQKALPIVVESLTELHEATSVFTEPFLEIGEFLLDNPDVMVSTLVGIGSTLITFKMARNVMSLSTSFMSLINAANPLTRTLTLLGFAVGGASGIASYFSIAEKKIRQANLEEHFGNITLSMEELKEVANDIVGTDSFSGIHEALAAFEDVDKVAERLDENFAALNKANWKAEIGIVFTTSEQEEYLENIQNVSDNAKELLENDQYAMDMALGEFGVSDSVKEKVNNTYASLREAVEAEAAKMGEIASKAFEDNMLNIDVASVINKYSQNIQEITNKISAAEFDAKMKALEMDYSGAALDSDSYLKLQEELTAVIESEKESAASVRDEALRGIEMTKSEGGFADENEYKKAVSDAQSAYLTRIAEAEARSVEFQLNTVNDTYNIDDIRTETLNMVDNELEELFGSGQEIGLDTLNRFGEIYDEARTTTGLSESSFKNVTKLLENTDIENLESSVAALQAMGKEVPQELQDILKRYSEYKAIIAGDEKTRDIKKLFDQYLIREISDNEEYYKGFQKLQGYAEEYDSKVLGKEHDENRTGKRYVASLNPEIDTEKHKREVVSQTEQIYKDDNFKIKSIFGKGFEVESEIKLSLSTILGKADATSIRFGNYSFKNPLNLPGFADGGIITKPTLATFAEDVPEAAIPLDGSKHSIDLWKTTGQMLGIFDENKKEAAVQMLKSDYSTKNSGFVFSPVINISSTSENNEGRMRTMIQKIMQEQFQKCMKEYEYQSNRKSFG